MDNIQIGKFISEQRKENNLTQEAFADKIGVSQKTVSRWETGKNMPDYSVLSVICDTLGITVTELLNGKKIEGESIPKADESAAYKSLTEMFKKRKNIGKIIGAAISFLLMVFFMILLYISEFNINDLSSTALENKIKDHFYKENLDYYEIIPKVLRTEIIDGKIHILFSQENSPGDSGTVELERGLLGRYRIKTFNKTNDKIMPLDESNDHKYLSVWNVNDLPDVAAFEIVGTGDDESDIKETYYKGEYTGAPYFKVIPIDTNYWISERFFDASGHEITRKELADKMGVDINSSGGGGSIEASFMVYAYEIVFLLIGLVFIRYFLIDVIRDLKKDC